MKKTIKTAFRFVMVTALLWTSVIGGLPPQKASAAVYTYNQTTVDDVAGSTTITNGALKIVYNKSNGLADYYWSNVKKAGGMYSEFATTATFKSKDYTSHTFSTANVATFNDGFGTGTRITFVNTASGKADIRQNYYIYDGKPFFLTDTQVVSGTAISSNYMAPLKSDSGATSINSSANKRALNVPFDNDKWVRYDAKPANSSSVSYEAFATYDNDSRNGLVLGSISHDVWKTGIWYYGTGNNVTEMQVYGGVANSNTRDVDTHGKITGTSLWSPKIFVGYYADWRTGMEEYGQANATQNGAMSWSGGVPFGWNSWGSVQTNLNYNNAVATSNWIKNNIQNNNFSNNNTVYINLDSYWDNLSDTELTNYVNAVHANGQKAGIYWAPFVYWGDDMNQAVEGSSYKYGDIVLKKFNGTRWDKSLDGAYPVDPTHPGSKQRINYFIDKFKSKGFDYIKLDFLTHGSLEGIHYDNAVNTGIQAYNQGMAYVRDRIAGSMFISLSIAPLFPSQYGHARRISCDVYGDLNGDVSTEYLLNSLSYGWWQNGTVYKYTDPDHMVLKSNIEEARSRVNSGVIAGTVFLNGNDVTNTAQQAIVSQLMTNNAVNSVARLGKAFRAVEGNTGTAAADAFVLQDGSIYYIALFNFSTSASKNMSVSLSRAGLNGSQTYTVTDLWTGAVTTAQGTLSVALQPYQSKLVKLN
ncbi:alpha-galactosidase [Paenibacillus sp. NPDC058174]|uniref:alpha-galactosidase n=1 Tax=Paenibacillus sp. NPDC058174 TaxID=3346366 RepID=UPI0036DAEF95